MYLTSFTPPNNSISYYYNSLFPDDETKVEKGEVKQLEDGACPH